MHSTSPPSRQQLAPDWLAHRYDPGHDAVHFIQVDRTTRLAEPFLIDQHLPTATAPVVIRRADALALAPTGSALHFIFHSAYCCSTLLANVLDRPGTANSLKEPLILNDIVGWRHRGGASDLVWARLRDALTLLARPFEPGEATIVKPSNLVNGLAEAMLQIRPEARGILLYAPLPVYLGSIAAKGMWGRLWVRDLLVKQLHDGPIDFGFTTEDHLRHTDLQVAAIGWLVQHRLFVKLARQWPTRVRMLDSEVLLARPHDTIRAIVGLFELAADAPTITALAASPAFRRNAKNNRAFDRSDRLAGQQESATLHGEELGKVLVWANAVAAKVGLDLGAPHSELHLSS